MRAREIISQGWTQGTYARNKDNEEVFHDSSEAVCFCLEGAIIRSIHENNFLNDEKILLYNLQTIIKNNIQNRKYGYYYPSTVCWNDKPERTKEEVLNLFDNIIEKIKEKED